ncbi:MAG: DUF4157 domain-containing protein, partial [Myxococcales bacterium]|nr:DUF4157 domain-containing protein [Myxococcales bacterium]
MSDYASPKKKTDPLRRKAAPPSLHHGAYDDARSAPPWHSTEFAALGYPDPYAFSYSPQIPHPYAPLAPAPPSISAAPGQVQAKLEIGDSTDPLEAEADRVAEHVLTAGPVAAPAAPTPPPAISTRAPLVQRDASPPAAAALLAAAPAAATAHAPAPLASAIAQQRASGGNPLPADERTFMETRFGRDFSAVRVHTGSSANDLNARLGARAFTLGTDLFFADGQYEPGSQQGRRLLAHELAHTVQQQGGAERVQRDVIFDAVAAAYRRAREASDAGLDANLDAAEARRFGRWIARAINSGWLDPQAASMALSHARNNVNEVFLIPTNVDRETDVIEGLLPRLHNRALVRIAEGRERSWRDVWQRLHAYARTRGESSARRRLQHALRGELATLYHLHPVAGEPGGERERSLSRLTAGQTRERVRHGIRTREAREEIEAEDVEETQQIEARALGHARRAIERPSAEALIESLQADEWHY